MDVYEAIRTRRSIRRYKPDPIPDEVLKRVLDAARLAPSANNIQPWKFI
ncbi:MAG: oxidoreductase, partial [Planctomycetes bacterium]|nr:oxidoreductase [Planctomycetota bacterium]